MMALKAGMTLLRTRRIDRQTLRTTLGLIAKKMEEAAEEISCIQQVLVCVCVLACVSACDIVSLLN
jgi:hypothetical protein